MLMTQSLNWWNKRENRGWNQKTDLTVSTGKFYCIKDYRHLHCNLVQILFTKNIADLFALCFEVIGWLYIFDERVQVVQKSMSHLNNVDMSRVTWNKFHTENPQVSGATIQNVVAWVTWHPELVHTCISFSILLKWLGCGLIFDKSCFCVFWRMPILVEIFSVLQDILRLYVEISHNWYLPCSS